MAVGDSDMTRRAFGMVILPSADRGGSSQLKEKPKPHLPIMRRASCIVVGEIGIQGSHVKDPLSMYLEGK
jgi:hypothetical protein